MSIMMYMLRNTLRQSQYSPIKQFAVDMVRASSSNEKPISPRMEEFKKKIRETTPITELNQELPDPNQQSPMERYPNDTNPETGEIGGPRKIEPTRYGDWERKGRAVDF